MQYCTASLTAIPSFLPPGSDRAFHRLHLTLQTAQSRNAKSELVPDTQSRNFTQGSAEQKGGPNQVGKNLIVTKVGEAEELYWGSSGC